MDRELSRALDVATALAFEAGAVTMRYFGTDLRVDDKGRGDPVTEADRASQALIVAGLRREFPDYGVLAEEKDDTESWAERRLAWVVDPLDGTKDFVAGRPGWSVMIGLLRDFEPVLGVMHQPTTGLTFRAAPGLGSVMSGPEGETRLQTSPWADLARLRLVTSQVHRSPKIDRVKSELGTRDELNVGSAGLKISLVARGERELYVNPEGHCRLWDTCAPQVVLEQAGGRISDRHGDPIRYAPDAIRLERGIIASNGPAHDAVIAKLARVFGPRPQKMA